MYHFELLSYWGNSDANLYECGIHQCEPYFSMDERFLRKNDIIHFIVMGKGTFRFGKQEYRLSAGQGFYIPAHTPVFYQADWREPWLYCWVIFGGVKLKEYLHTAHISRRNPVFHCPNPDRYYAIIDKMLKAGNSTTAGAEPQMFAWCYELLSMVLKENAHAVLLPKPEFHVDEYVSRAITYMQKHLGEQIRMTDLAQHVRLHPNYFCSIFEHCIGRSPKNYLITLRMQQARTFLMSTKKSISLITEAVGYQSVSAFSKAFTKQVGISPREYRKMYEQGNLTMPDRLPFKPPFANNHKENNRMLQIPLDQVAFSVPQSYLTLRKMDDRYYAQELHTLPHGIYMRLTHAIGRPLVFRLVPLLDGNPVKSDVSCTPAGMMFTRQGHTLKVSFEDENTLIASGERMGLRLDMPSVTYEYAALQSKTRCLLNASVSYSKWMVSAVQGSLRLDAPYGEARAEYIHCDLLPDEQGVMRMAAAFFEQVWEERSYVCDIDASFKRWGDTFQDFCRGFAKPPQRYRQAMEHALYILFSSTVASKGHLKRQGVLMSNSWMMNVWTWDSAINAMGLSLGNAQLAWDQWVIPFDHQHESGLLPDYISPHEIMWNFTKPPVHGIALATMLEGNILLAQAAQMYESLALQVHYWLVYTDSDHDGIPEYGHGNDCGWDNCTSFAMGPPVEGPDLSAYLVIQMEILSKLAQYRGDSQAAATWIRKSEELLDRLLQHSLHDGRFQVYQSGTHSVAPYGDSLFAYMPLVLGHRLTRRVFMQMTTELKQENRFLTDYGLATESISSPHYETDGYWRGPIWAPTMLLLIQGIADGGDVAFANLLATRFCDMVTQQGFGENFDALSGTALRDPSYTWTASAFIVLACRYVTA